MFGSEALLCIVSYSCSAVMKCRLMSAGSESLCPPPVEALPHLSPPLPRLTHSGGYATLCRTSREEEMERSARKRACDGARGTTEGARAGLRQAGSGIPYRFFSVCLLHSSPPSFLTHPPSLHFFRTKVADKDEAA